MPPGLTSTRNAITQDSLRYTTRGRPWINELFNVFACLIESLELKPHREYFKMIPNSFTNFEAIDAMKALSFYITDREQNADGKWSARTTTYTLRADPAGTTKLILHFCQARLLSTHGNVSGDRLCIFTLSPKGLHVLEQALDNHNMEDRLRGALNGQQPILERMLHFKRYTHDDEIILSDQVIYDSFRRFVGHEPNYEPSEKESLRWDEFKKHEKRSLGIQLIDYPESHLLPRFVRGNNSSSKHGKRLCFGGYEAIAWLVDFMSIYGSEEAGPLAAQYVRYGLIELVADKRKAQDTGTETHTARGHTNGGSGRNIAQVAEYIGLDKVTYKITDEGRRIANWDDPSKSEETLTEAASRAPPKGAYAKMARNGTSAEAKTLRPTAELAPKDSNTDRLNQIINDVPLRRQFREFLVSRHCAENLAFWLAVDELQRDFNGLARVVRPNVPRSGQTESRRQLEQLTERARSIFNEYLAEHSPFELNLDYGQRHELINSVTNVFMGPPGTGGRAVDTGQLHDVILVQYRKIQDHVFRLMANDSVPNFTLTHEYSRLRREPLTKPAPRPRGPLFMTKNDRPPGLASRNSTEEVAGIHYTLSMQAAEQRSAIRADE